MHPIGSMRFTRARPGFAVLASAFLVTGVSSAAFGATGSSVPACTSSCPSLTRLSITNPVTSYGSEQNVVFNVRVKDRVLHTGLVPTGSVTVAYQGTVLCTIVLSAGMGSCSPSATALPSRNHSYPVNATYGGDPVFLGSHSGARHVLVLP